MAAAPLENDLADPLRQECQEKAVKLLLTTSTQGGGTQRFRGAVTALKEQIDRVYSAEMRKTAAAIIDRIERENWRKFCPFRRHVLVLLVVLGVHEEEIEALRKHAHVTPQQRAEAEEIHSASMSVLRDEAEQEFFEESDGPLKRRRTDTE